MAAEDAPNRLRSLSVLLNLLVALFLVLPVLLFLAFSQLDQARRALALDTIRDSGMLIGSALRPTLEALPPGGFGRIQADLDGFSALNRRITLLYKPNFAAGGAGFFYVAGVPAVAAGALALERQRLVDMGVLDRLSQVCAGNTPLTERIELPGQRAELLTSVSPINSANGCWAVLVASDNASELSLADQRAYWARPEVQLAVGLYLAMAVICLWIYVRLRDGLAAFRRVAQTAAIGGSSFAAETEVSEFVPLAREFDRMVARLNQAAATLRKAAEENAHALKGKVATIRHLAAALPEAEPQAAIMAALDRLDGLVASARLLDTATAESLDGRFADIDLSALVEAFCRDCRLMLGDASGRLVCDIAPGIRVRGNEEMLEVILENLVENALSFTPAPGEVSIRASHAHPNCAITVTDQGPGVDPSLLAAIFERYMSTRPAESETHYGIGLWLVRQNALAMGGSVTARNVGNGGLEMSVILPMIDRKGQVPLPVT